MIPPNASAPSGPYPRANASPAAGIPFSKRSTRPACQRFFSDLTSSLAEYSKPSTRRSNRAPISAPTFRNSSLSSSGARPPFPRAKPARRNNGTLEILSFRASQESNPRETKTRPISRIVMFALAVACTLASSSFMHQVYPHKDWEEF